MLLWGQDAFMPTQRPDLKLWLDAYDASTITESGLAVSQWNDKSGQGNHATQGTGSAQPTYAPNTLNGKAVLTFDGGDFLDIPSGLYTIPNGDNTVFVVSKRNTETGSQEQLLTFVQTGVAARLGIQYPATAGRVSYFNQFNGGTAPENTGNTNTNYQILTGFRSGTTQSISVNGNTAVSNADATSSALTDVIYLGSSQGILYLTGGIAEVLIYARALSAAEIIMVNTYLSRKWAITI